MSFPITPSSSAPNLGYKNPAVIASTHKEEDTKKERDTPGDTHMKIWSNKHLQYFKYSQPRLLKSPLKRERFMVICLFSNKKYLFNLIQVC